jgi:16S rRNA (cytidine1402-2'-O)-methyltransferase
MSGRLYLVPSTLDFGVPASASAPDLQDMLPLGVIRIAARLHYWVVENAKSTRAFLKRVEQVVPLAQPLQALSIVELPRAPKGRTNNESAAPLMHLLAPLHEGHDIGLLSEAGLPAVADPGADVIRLAHDAGIEVVALAGASSLALSLAASGLNGQSFAFVGYLPVDAAARAKRIRELEDLSRRFGQTQLMIETPYRNAALLQALVDHLHVQTRLSVSCALTLASGWTRTRTIAQWRTNGIAMPADLPAVFAFLAG